VTVESGSEECIVIRASGMDGRMASISGNYDCLDDDLSARPVSVKLYDSKERAVWRSSEGASEGTFRTVGRGRYRLCISNGVDGGGAAPDGRGPGGRRDGQDREVGFSIRVRDLVEERRELVEKRKADKKAEKEEEENSKTVEKASQMGALTEDLVERLMSMRDHQAYLRQRDETHRNLAESTFGLLIKWTMVEAAALVLVAGGQILYLRKFFESRRYL